jgi:hypothetical protein
MDWGGEIELEKKRRINVSLWAYAYEFLNESLVEDYIFDAECLLVKPEIETGSFIEDKFFKNEFTPSTGMWVRKHPDLTGLAFVYWIKTRSQKDIMAAEEINKSRVLNGYFPLLPRHVFEQYFYTGCKTKPEILD